MTERQDEDDPTGPAGGSDWFWDLIAGAQCDRGRLRESLLPLGRQELRRFQAEFLDLARELIDEPYDAYVEESEDGFNDVAEWVVSQGKDAYFAVVRNPSSIPHTVDGRGRAILSGVAPKVFEDKFGDMMDIY